MDLSEKLSKNKSFKPKEARRELILHLLQEYGPLQTEDIAEVLGFGSRTIRRTLKTLEDMGEIEKNKLGRTYIWKISDDEPDESIYF